MGLKKISFDNEGITTAFSFAKQAEAAAQDLAQQLLCSELGFVLFFLFS